METSLDNFPSWFGIRDLITILIKNWIIVQCNSRDLIGVATIVYEPLYHACSKNSDH